MRGANVVRATAYSLLFVAIIAVLPLRDPSTVSVYTEITGLSIDSAWISQGDARPSDGTRGETRRFHPRLGNGSAIVRQRCRPLRLLSGRQQDKSQTNHHEHRGSD